MLKIFLYLKHLTSHYFAISLAVMVLMLFPCDMEDEQEDHFFVSPEMKYLRYDLPVDETLKEGFRIKLLNTNNEKQQRHIW